MSDEITKMSGEMPNENAYDNPGANGIDRDAQNTQDLVKKLSDLDASIGFSLVCSSSACFTLISSLSFSTEWFTLFIGQG
jgi:hypothetical protein